MKCRARSCDDETCRGGGDPRADVKVRCGFLLRPQNDPLSATTLGDHAFDQRGRSFRSVHSPRFRSHVAHERDVRPALDAVREMPRDAFALRNYRFTGGEPLEIARGWVQQWDIHSVDLVGGESRWRSSLTARCSRTSELPAEMPSSDAISACE